MYFRKCYVNNINEFEKFKNKLFAIKKYHEFYEIFHGKKFKFIINAIHGPDDFVNFCEFKITGFFWNQADEDWEEINHEIWFGHFAIQNYNLECALIKAKEIINDNKNKLIQQIMEIFWNGEN